MSDAVSPARKAAMEAANWLVGTCRSLEGSEWESWQNDAVFLRALDDEVFCCDDCGWWCGTEQLDDAVNLICEDCGGGVVDDE
jgi:hypothetical protein